MAMQNAGRGLPTRPSLSPYDLAGHHSNRTDYSTNSTLSPTATRVPRDTSAFGNHIDSDVQLIWVKGTSVS